MASVVPQRAICPAVQFGSVALRYRLPDRWRRIAAWRHPGRPDRQERGERLAEGASARDEQTARLEAVLFLAREPLTSRKAAQLAGLADGTKARTLVRGLNRVYDTQGCAFRVVEVGGGFLLMTRPQFAPWLRRLHGAPVEVRLSAPALETLAVVAYRQPVLRVTIEAVRGVQCGEILRQLMQRDLVKIAGRSEELGRPFLYGTTKLFLQVFGLRNLDELPGREWFEPPETTHAPAPDDHDPTSDDDHAPFQTNPDDSRIASSPPDRYKEGSDLDPADQPTDPAT